MTTYSRSKWGRLIVEGDIQFQADIVRLRREYGLPLKGRFEDAMHLRWLDDDETRAARFHAACRETALRHKLITSTEKPLEFGSDDALALANLKLWLWYADPEHFFEPLYPVTHISWDAEGTPHQSVTVTSDTDLTDPKIVGYIKRIQRDSRPLCPKPILQGRKMDWRPVLEHRKRYKMTHYEIAREIGYNPDYVRRKLSEIEDDLG